MKKVLILKAGDAMSYEEREVKKVELKLMQEVVDGYIEIPFLSERLTKEGIDVVINEEGKLIGLEPTIAVMHKGKMVDMVVGNVMFCGHDGKGNSIGLTEEQIEKVKHELSLVMEVKSRENGTRWAVRVLNI